MFFGHIKQVDLNLYPTAIQKALVYLQSTDFDTMPVGRYSLEGDLIYVQVLDLTTQEKDCYEPECHRQYLDVQYLHSGVEKIGVAIDLGDNEIAQEYDPERDILFYKNVQNETMLTMRPGNFAVFFPTDIHHVSIIDGEDKNIRKIVVKVAMSLLD